MHNVLQKAYHEIDPPLAVVRDGLDQLKDDSLYPDHEALVQFNCVAAGLGENAGEWVDRHLLAYDHLKPTDPKWAQMQGLFVFSGEMEPELVEHIVRWVLGSPRFASMVKGEEGRFRYIDLTISEADKWQTQMNPKAVYKVRVECKGKKNAGISFFMEIEQDDLPGDKETAEPTSKAASPDRPPDHPAT